MIFLSLSLSLFRGVYIYAYSHNRFMHILNMIDRFVVVYGQKNVPINYCAGFSFCKSKNWHKNTIKQKNCTYFVCFNSLWRINEIKHQTKTEISFFHYFKTWNCLTKIQQMMIYTKTHIALYKKNIRIRLQPLYDWTSSRKWTSHKVALKLTEETIKRQHILDAENGNYGVGHSSVAF